LYCIVVYCIVLYSIVLYCIITVQCAVQTTQNFLVSKTNRCTEF